MTSASSETKVERVADPAPGAEGVDANCAPVHVSAGRDPWGIADFDAINVNTKVVTVRMNKVIGQLQGIQKMVEKDRYCVDILIQLSSVVGALHKIEDLVMKQHMEHCVAEAMASGHEDWKEEKINEVINIVTRFRKR
jgi:DNA-binding FrmR family transcriptional regulator